MNITGLEDLTVFIAQTDCKRDYKRLLWKRFQFKCMQMTKKGMEKIHLKYIEMAESGKKKRKPKITIEWKFSYYSILICNIF